MASNHADRIARWNSKISQQWAKCHRRVDRYNKRILKTKTKMVDGRTGDHVYVCEAGAAAVPYINYRCTRYSIDIDFDATFSGSDTKFHIENIEHVAKRIIGDVSLAPMTDVDLTPSDTTGAIEKFIEDMDDEELMECRWASLYDVSVHGDTGVRHIYHIRNMPIDVWQQMHIPASRLFEGTYCLARFTEMELEHGILVPQPCWRAAGIPLADVGV